MFDLTTDAKNAIQEVKICFGDLVKKDKDEVFVVLTEPDTFDVCKMKGKTKEELMAPEFIYGYFRDIFPKYLIDHSFVNKGEKASSEEVRDFIFRKLAVADYVSAQYFTEVFLSPQSKKEEK